MHNKSMLHQRLAKKPRGTTAVATAVAFSARNTDGSGHAVRSTISVNLDAWLLILGLALLGPSGLFGKSLAECKKSPLGLHTQGGQSMNVSVSGEVNLEAHLVFMRKKGPVIAV